nr:hypothetical protein Iba_chr10bCG8030 [Ipomoea batatas]
MNCRSLSKQASPNVKTLTFPGPQKNLFSSQKHQLNSKTVERKYRW